MKSEKDKIDQSKDFLFDPYAAAYYARFTEFNPHKQSLTAYLVTQDVKAGIDPKPNLQLDLQSLKMTHYYNEYCQVYEPT